MGKTFVYNAGKSEEVKESINLTLGLFFDGTGNNLKNTEIRKKFFGIEEYTNAKPSEHEKEIYEKKGTKRKYYWIGKKVARNNSFKEDFTNVARMKLCANDSYATYIEGIGTEDEKKDNYAGLGLGKGFTGIRAKVKKGCTKLVFKIGKIYEKNDEITSIKLTIDVFGFSRGAAAARNFIYEINKAPYTPILRSNSTKSSSFYLTDSFNDLVEDSDLINGKLPPHGHLGLRLKREGVKDDLIIKMNISIRFVGLYDTVASYGFNHENDTEQLNLNSLGAPSKLVHFTALDEHRKNFPLTKTNIGLQMNFPGVHSDIGGSYNTEEEEIKKLAFINHPNTKSLIAYKQELIDEGWYHEDLQNNKEELTMRYSYSVYGHQMPMELKAYRSEVKKEYSFLILQYMEQYALEFFSGKEMRVFTTSQYKISEYPLLLKVKSKLDKYINGEEGEWRLSNEINLPKLEKENKNQDLSKTIKLNPIIINANDNLLKTLRHDYLHRSADYARFGMDPTINCERVIIEG